MKIRIGFISNSSSCSFCIYGVTIKADDTIEQEEIIERAEKADLEALYGPDYDTTIYVGRSWRGIGNDETGAIFKADVEKKVKEAFGPNTYPCSTWEEGWYNG